MEPTTAMDAISKAHLVTVVTWPVAVSHARLKALRAMLSQDERERLAGMPANTRAQEFIVGRAGSREILARICGCAPGEIIFKSGPRGKLDLAFPNAPIAFNLSHSSGICAFAFGQAAAIGIDIEQSQPHFHDVLDSTLTQREATQLARVPAVRQQDIFFRAWVAKEAYLKATGDGLAGGFHSLELDFDALPELRPVTIQNHVDGSGEWFFHAFEVGHSLLGAVAVKATHRNFTVKIHHERTEDALSGRDAFILEH